MTTRDYGNDCTYEGNLIGVDCIHMRQVRVLVRYFHFYNVQNCTIGLQALDCLPCPAPLRDAQSLKNLGKTWPGIRKCSKLSDGYFLSIHDTACTIQHNLLLINKDTRICNFYTRCTGLNVMP